MPAAYTVNQGLTAGQIWYDINTMRFKIYTGTHWADIEPVDISLHPDADAAITWAQKRMQEEAQLEQLMQQHPGLRDAKQSFDAMLALVREYEQRKD